MRAFKAKNPLVLTSLRARSGRLVPWVEQAVQMHDEVAHMSVVNGAVGGVLPGVVGLRVVWVDADDIELLEIAELDFAERRKLASEHEVKQLLTAFLGAVLCRHVLILPPRGSHSAPIWRQRSMRAVR